MAEKTTTDVTYENTSVPAEDKAATAAAEMELNVSLDQLSYICEYCGKVNAISSPNCVRCGKRRPRSEYINAMNKIKNAQSVKAQYIEEQAKLATDRQEAAQQQLVRLVESRVADEKAQIMAQEAVRLEQEREEIKRTTARDAVLRIIAAERAADEKVKAAETRADEAISGRSRETEERIAAEREKVLYAAAKRVISERAGIENAAEERIAAERKSTEQKAQETIANAVDEAEKSAARRAVLKVVANEQAAEDRARLERDAISRAAMDRVAEERRIAEINAYSKYKVEREAIERAVDERIKAEREMLYGRRGSASVSAQGGSVQPLTIVPYVDSHHPLYQYKTTKTVYKFVPDEAPAQEKRVPAVSGNVTPVKEKRKGFGAVRILSIFTAIFAVVVLLTVVLSEQLSIFEYVKEGVNLDILMSLFKGELEGTAMIAPIGILVMAIGAAATLICGIAELIRGKAGAEFWICALVALVGAIVTLVGFIVSKAIDTSDIMGSMGIGMIIALAAALVALILAIVATAVCGKKKRAEIDA